MDFLWFTFFFTYDTRLSVKIYDIKIINIHDIRYEM